MVRSSRKHTYKVFLSFGGECHYCRVKTIYRPSMPRPNMATKDHIVPKAFGGANSMENYVLACAECNEERGTSLFYCTCDHCYTLITNALNDQRIIDIMFEGIIGHNKPRIYSRSGGWYVRRGHNAIKYETWNEAIASLYESEKANDS